MYVNKMEDDGKCQQVESRQERFSVTSVLEFQRLQRKIIFKKRESGFTCQLCFNGRQKISK